MGLQNQCRYCHDNLPCACNYDIEYDALSGHRQAETRRYFSDLTAVGSLCACRTHTAAFFRGAGRMARNAAR